MLQAIPDSVFRIDRNGLILEYKAEHLSQVRVSEAFFLSRRIADVLPVDVAQHGLTVIAEALDTGEARVFEYQLEIDGKDRAYEARLAACGTDEVVVLVRDVTQQKEVERLKEELVSTVSHELRTPLTSIRGFTELMLSRSFSPEQQREFLLILQREAVHLTNLINDFLDLRRMEAGREVYDIAAVALEPLLQHCLALFRDKEESHTFRLEIPSVLPLVEADESRIHRVAVNLLSNAVKFSPDGGEIILGAQPDKEHMLLWVKDSGIGISQDILPKVFDRFFRADNRATRSVGGTGLGLSLVKEILTAHRGRIWVESTPGEGSTFFFTLPLLQPGEQSPDFGN
jgi:signal transduction histidine kinase